MSNRRQPEKNRWRKESESGLASIPTCAPTRIAYTVQVMLELVEQFAYAVRKRARFNAQITERRKLGRAFANEQAGMGQSCRKIEC